jgi:hypothetical protein
VGFVKGFDIARRIERKIFGARAVRRGGDRALATLSDLWDRIIRLHAKP